MSIINTTDVDVTKYRDFSYKGHAFSKSIDSSNPFVLSGIAAIKNVIKLYLMSSQGDYGRNISKGGPMIDFLAKPITDLTEDKIKKAIVAAMAQYSNIVVYDVVVVKDLINKGWVVTINFYDTYNKYVDSMDMAYRDN